MTPDPWGIEDGYWDIRGRWHDTEPAVRRRLRVAMGGLADVADPPPHTRPVWFVRHGTTPPIDRPAELVLEDGSTTSAVHHLSPDLPLGYHDLHPSDGGPTTRLIITPDRCALPEGLRSWGWAVQLYAARSTRSWGIGDLADLQAIARWSRELGAGFLAINPLHAPLPLPHQEPSPYFPSSRRFRNPLYISVERVPGFDPSDPVLSDAAAAGRALDADRTIDRDRVLAVKMAALELLWKQFEGHPRFDEFAKEQGRELGLYGTFCVLTEEHGTATAEWPAEHRRSDSPSIERFARANADRVWFHCWLQWLLDEQLAAAASEIPLLGDLAIGVDAGGADAWIWQDVLAHGVRIGAPPDEFNVAGQDWGLPPFVPWKLRALGYEPLARTIRASLRHCRALRIDHVMGLFRLYWIPDDCTPEQGTYVRYPTSELLDVFALESARAGALIVGEDLGTVEDEVRERLSERCVLSYRLAWFEASPPENYPEQAFAAITTHDLPTIAGTWDGTDVEDQRAAGIEPNLEGAEAQRDRLLELTGLGTDAPVDQIVVGAHARLATSPSMLVAATLDDAACVSERPNLPGTTTERANWSIALPRPLEDLMKDGTVLAVAQVLADARPEGFTD